MKSAIFICLAWMGQSLWGSENALKSFHPSEIVLARDHDESRIQFLLSFEFDLVPLESLGWHLGTYRLMGLNFAYEGLFDFYTLTRHSHPVVSRLQNPGFYFSFKSQDRTLDAGWFHESNGQVVDTLNDYRALLAKEGPGALEKVSRAWDYWYLSSKFGSEIKGADLRFTFIPSLRIFTGAQGVVLPAEHDIFWKPQDPPCTIYDFDGIRGLLQADWRWLSLGAEIRTGYNAETIGRNWSEKLELTIRTWHIPWYLYYFNGFGPYISDYSTRSEGYGAGMRVGAL